MKFQEKGHLTSLPETKAHFSLIPVETEWNASIYIYSAVWGESLNMSQSTYDRKYPYSVILSGWQHPKLGNLAFRCCFLLQNRSIVSSNWTSFRKVWNFGGATILKATRYECQTNLEHTLINGVGINIWSSSCAMNVTQYRKLSIVPNSENIQKSIAICSKIAYGSLNAKYLVEWIETQRYMGVQKIISYVYKLNMDAINVLKHYEEIGIVETFPFEIPPASRYIFYFVRSVRLKIIGILKQV